MPKKLFILLLSMSVVALVGGRSSLRASETKEHHQEEGHHHSDEGPKHDTLGPHHHEEGQHHGHVAHHNGILCVLEKCDVGHIETLLEGDTLEAWFVGGGRDTDRSVRVEAEEVPLKVRLAGEGERTLVLKAAPMRLAGEKVGDASHFIAKADWLKGVKEFEAEGEVVFKGIRRKLVIRYPQGYDPDHGNGHEHEKHHEQDTHH